MPQYEYEITSVDGVTRIGRTLQSASEPDLTTWPETGESCRKLVSSFSCRTRTKGIAPEDESENRAYKQWYEDEMVAREERNVS